MQLTEFTKKLLKKNPKPKERYLCDDKELIDKMHQRNKMLGSILSKGRHISLPKLRTTKNSSKNSNDSSLEKL